MLEKILLAQLEGGNSEDYSMDYTQADFDVTIPILENELKSNGFRFIDKIQFNAKIKSVFNRTIDLNSSSEYLYVNSYSKCDREMIWKLNDNIDYQGLFIIKNKSFISEFYAIPQLIDYQKEYPNASKIEEKPIIIKNEIEDHDMEIGRWKDNKNLSRQRQENIQILVARNKYLFNDSRADFVWLSFNDEYFLQSLVKTFGYDDDENLNKFVLDKNLKDDEEFGKVIWNKDCSSKIKFNLNIFETIKKASKGDQEKYFEAIRNYLSYFVNTPNNYLDLTFSEKAEISGKIAYYATKIVGQQSDYYFKLFTYVNSEEDQKEFEKQNYYNIKDFKEIYFETKTGGVAYPGMIE
ncbi:hypothetical protein [Flavobacterium sp.]|uniref:hypothetical protein n=1 Tax=Flavobacterium sp. TaxID=239 RepID=UPI003753D162